MQKWSWLPKANSEKKGVFGEAGVMGLMRWECWFPILTVPVCHTCRFKQHKFIILEFGGQMSEIRAIGLTKKFVWFFHRCYRKMKELFDQLNKIKMLEEWCSFWKPWGEWDSLPFLDFRLPHILQLVALPISSRLAITWASVSSHHLWPSASLSLTRTLEVVLALPG